MKSLRDYTDYQLESWYNSWLTERVKRTGYSVRDHSPQSSQRHDFFNVYDYGDVIKVVYFKSAPALKRQRNDCGSVPKGGSFRRDDCKAPAGLDLVSPPEFSDKVKASSERRENQRFQQSVSRAKARIFELAMCNEFTYFCTFTQDEKKRDRFDLTEFCKDFGQLVRNINRSREAGQKIKYLLIPERHKNGAWHMHGLLKGLTSDDLRPFKLSENIPKRIKDKLREGVQVYDWQRYRSAFGYFTCTEIENPTACSKYITKYVTKDMTETVRASGAHLFFASQGLNGRRTVVKNCTELCPVSQWDYENDYIKIKEFSVSRD